MGVIVAAGMLGGLALLLAKLTQQQQASQKKAETMTELTVLHQKILSIFYDGESCTKTFGAGTVLRVGDGIDELKNREGVVVLKKGHIYNRLLEVKSIKIVQIEGSVSKTRELEIEVTFEKKGASHTGYKEVKKQFPITVELSAVTPDMTLDRCHQTLDGKEQGIKEQMCTDMGGEMVPIPGTAMTRCSVDNLYQKFCRNMGGDYTTAPDMKCSVSPILQKLCTSLGGAWNGTDCDIASVYVNVTGDNIVGDFQTKNIACSSLRCPSQNISAKGAVAGSRDDPGGSHRGGVDGPAVGAQEKDGQKRVFQQGGYVCGCQNL